MRRGTSSSSDTLSFSPLKVWLLTALGVFVLDAAAWFAGGAFSGVDWLTGPDVFSIVGVSVALVGLVFFGVRKSFVTGLCLVLGVCTGTAVAWGTLLAIAVTDSPCPFGCEVPDVAGDARGLPGVIAVKVRGSQWESEVPTNDVDVLMKRTSRPEDLMAVADAYADDLKEGNVMMLSVVIEGGANRARLYVFDSSGTSLAMAKDVLAAAHDPHLLRYELGTPDQPHGLDFALANADLPTLADAVASKRGIKGVEFVYGESGAFGIRWDPFTEDTQLTRRRLTFCLEMNRHIPLTGAGIDGYIQDSHYDELSLQVADRDLDAATAYVRAHRNPRLGKIDLASDSARKAALNPDEMGGEVWTPPFPSAKEMADAKDEVRKYGGTLVTPG